MPRYIKYPLIALAVGAAIYFAGGSDKTVTAPAQNEIDARADRATIGAPNSLITDGSVRPPQ